MNQRQYRLFDVYYAKRDYQVEYWREETALPVINNITDTHVLVNTVSSHSLEDVYYRMQGEDWNPGNEFILSKGLGHTSMSMGDVIYDYHTKKWYLCAHHGWVELIGNKS